MHFKHRYCGLIIILRFHLQRHLVVHRAASKEWFPTRTPSPRRQQDVLRNPRPRMPPEQVLAKVTDQLPHARLCGWRQLRRPPECLGDVSEEVSLPQVDDHQAPRYPTLEGQPHAVDVVGDDERNRTVPAGQRAERQRACANRSECAWGECAWLRGVEGAASLSCGSAR